MAGGRAAAAVAAAVLVWCVGTAADGPHAGLAGAAEDVAAVAAAFAAPDPAGYLLYCGCMGRFGNQAEHLLGAVAFAKALNRTLVLPPFIGYSRRGSSFLPFDLLFNLAAVREYHRAMTLEAFMATLAPTIWPPHERYMYCIQFDDKPADCRTKQGNPFKAFWDHAGVDFDGGDRAVRFSYSSPAQAWQREFPPELHPVVALRGAPASFPMQAQHRPLQRLLRWQPEWVARGEALITGSLPRPFVGVHLRHGTDWKRACQHAIGHHSYMATPQCKLPSSGVTEEVCFQSASVVLAQLSALVHRVAAKSVFVGTDDRAFVAKLRALAAQQRAMSEVPIVTSAEDDPLLDLRVFGEADHFLGNCVSSFTSFAVRERRLNARPVAFFGLADSK